MTIFLEEPRQPSSPTFAGGVASLGDIAGAAYDSLTYVENTNAAATALERAYDERIAAVHEATGAMLQNPLREAEAERNRLLVESGRAPWSQEPPVAYADIIAGRQRDFAGQLFQLGEKFPLARATIGADRSVEDDARRIAREADERLSKLMESRDGLGKWAAVLAGGAVGSLRDPLTIASLALGGGPGAARTVAGRLLTVAGKEALINGTTEAVAQPVVQAWREEAGLDHGMQQAVNNVLFATVFGGAFGAAGQGIAEGMRPFVRARDIDRAAATLPAEKLDDAARAILADDGLAAAGSIARIREAMPPAARGALDEAARIADTDAQRPPSIDVDFHDRTVAAADRAIATADVEAWPGFSPDPAQVERITAEIFGPAAQSAPQADRGLIGFLMDRGGIEDFQGELRAIGADQVSERFKGKLVRKGGTSLDYSREAAAEAGFFDHLYGDPATAVHRSTIADLLNEIEAGIRGQPAARAPDAARARLEGVVAEIARHAGPAVDDAIISRAARLAVDEGMEPFDALERVLIAEDTPEGSAPYRDRAPLPGWSDEDLLAAADTRGGEPVADGIDDPGRLDADDFDMAEFDGIDDDMLMPGDGGTVRAGDLRERIAALENMRNVVAACRA